MKTAAVTLEPLLGGRSKQVSIMEPRSAAQLLLLVTVGAISPTLPPSSRRDVFRAGEAGYSCFRIPAVLSLPTGGYAVFAEARNKSCSDWAPTDIVVKTSRDGLNWGNMTVLCPAVGDNKICSNHDMTYKSSAHNPSPVVVNATTVLLVLENQAWGLRHTRLYSVRGTVKATAAGAPEIDWDLNATDMTEQNGWAGMGISPGAAGNGILMSSGRLLVPAHSDHWAAGAGAGAMYSDSHGSSWSLSTKAAAGGNECQLAQAPNGSVIMTTRGGGWLNLAWSHDQGDTFSDTVRNTSGGIPHVGTDCEASILRVPNSQKLLVSTPFDPAHGRRINMTVWQSLDSGASWGLLALVGLQTEDAAYSALSPFNSTHIAIVWERGYAASFLSWDLVALN